MKLKTAKMIIKGFGHVALDELGMLDEETKKMSVERLKKCMDCPLRNENGFCSGFREFEGVKGCNCYLPAASKVKEKECPRGLW